MTQEELAHLAGIHPSYLSYVELGRKVMSLHTLNRLAEALKLPIQALFGAVPEKKMVKYNFKAEYIAGVLKNASPADKNFINKAIKLIADKRKS